MRTILHSDLNNFYASVEMLRYPELKTVPTVVVGNKEDRHGVVLAKNIPAAAAGIRTGDVYWQAKEKCGNLVELPADFDAYLRAARLRDSALGKARTVHLSVRDAALNRYAKQGKPAFPTRSAADIADCAFSLFRSVYPWEHDVRSLGVSVSGFVSGPEQTNIFADIVSEQKAARLEKVIAELRAQYGNNIIRRATVLKDKRLAELDILNDHVIHPENFFGR